MILIDVAEPDSIVNLLKQSTDVTVMPLNQSNRADYYWGGEDNKTYQVCRVQVGELLSNIDSEEDEIRRYYESADRTIQVVEGIVTDTPLTKKDKSMESVSIRMKSRPSTLFSYRVAPNGYLFGEHAYDVGADKLYAWLFRLEECGVPTFFTHNYVGTAKLLATVYHNCQKTEHSTLNRYYIPRIRLGEKDEDSKKIRIREQNPFIRSLMALSIIYRIDVGEKKATALYKAGYRTLYDLAFSSVEELARVEGMGKVTAKKLLDAIGLEE
uniref:Helix-hairpin-helix DNA-binding motif class 1 domain-containing protein n=1 Tax=viral metagenome TaxID=1070528 RepID=A0A6M3IH84_9ZZZZ